MKKSQNNLTPGEIAKKYHNQQLKKNKKLQKPEKFHIGYVRTPTVYQMEVNECGAASLSMILSYYGKYVPLEELRVETGVSRNGCNAKHIYSAAEHYKLDVTASRRPLDKMLLKNKIPCMLHWNYSHFVVFEGKKFGKYYINDPAEGRRSLTYDELKEGYSETVMEFTPSSDFTKSKKPPSILGFIKKSLEGQEKTLQALFFIGLALIIPGLLTPVYSQVFVDDILVSGEISWMKWLLMFMILTAVFSSYFTYLNSKISMLLRSKMSLISTDKMISHMFRLPMVFFEQRYAGDLVSRVYNNMAVSSFLSGELVNVLISVVTGLIYLVIMLLYSPKLSLIAVVFSLLSSAVTILISTKIRAMTMKYGIDNGKLMGSLYNGLSSTASLKSVGAEGEYVARLLGYYADVSNNDQKLAKIQAILNIIPQSIGYINTVALLIFGSQEVINGNLTPGMLMSFSGFLAAFSSPFETIVSFARSIQQVKNDMMRVDDIMKYKEEDRYNNVKDEEVMGRKLRGEVSLENIAFAYGKLDELFIKNFNFKIQSGQSIALVGSSGCGKSTITKMISGLYEPWEGSILFDDVEIERIPEEVINSSVAVVTQNISIFDGTIFDNIRCWNNAITHEEVIAAAKDACLHDDITKKFGGYGFKLKENGSNISGGQRQRIEIAKALAGNPTILILDEATSALDAEIEKKIFDNIKRRHCTCIMVAQRLSTIRDCDEIIVMKHGRIEQRGTHEELISKAGLYRTLISEAM